MADGELRPWKPEGLSTCGCKPFPASEGAARARRFVTRFWARPEGGQSPCLSADGPTLGPWDDFAQRIRTHSLCISGMAFQDAWTLDLERIKDCCIHVVHPDGRLIPFCVYNTTDSAGRSPYRTVSREGAP